MTSEAISHLDLYVRQNLPEHLKPDAPVPPHVAEGDWRKSQEAARKQEEARLQAHFNDLIAQGWRPEELTDGLGHEAHMDGSPVRRAPTVPGWMIERAAYLLQELHARNLRLDGVMQGTLEAMAGYRFQGMQQRGQDAIDAARAAIRIHDARAQQVKVEQAQQPILHVRCGFSGPRGIVYQIGSYTIDTDTAWLLRDWLEKNQARFTAGRTPAMDGFACWPPFEISGEHVGAVAPVTAAQPPLWGGQ
jgi:hypothetical protein